MTARRIVVLTGAGISRESGLDTFRDPGGVWDRVPLESVATPEAFRRDPERVHAFYDARRARLPLVAPNPAHLALARLERAWNRDGGCELLLVTQNVDDLHERAGSARVLHMHGSLGEVRCGGCDAVSPWDGDGPVRVDTPCPRCSAPALRPNVVWFGEMPMHMQTILHALERCDLFVAIGTSGTVYPAADFVRIAGERADTIELNLEPTASRHLFDQSRAGPATVLVPALVAELLEA